MKKPILYITRRDMIQEVLVKVRFKVRFKNENVLFLTGCEERELSIKEMTEVNSLIEEDYIQPNFQYRIKRTGSVYEITFDGENFTAKMCVAMDYIVTYLKYPNTQRDPIAMFSESKGSTIEDQPVDISDLSSTRSASNLKWNRDREQAKNNLNDGRQNLNRFNQLKKLKKEDSGGLDDEEVEEFSRLKNIIGNEKSYWKKLNGFKAKVEGRNLGYYDEPTRRRNTMKNAILRFLKDLDNLQFPPVSSSAQNVQKRFSNHIRKSLTSGNMKLYTPPPGVTWILP